MTDVAPLSPEELAEVRKRHVPRFEMRYYGVDVFVCRADGEEWPCDAARAIATVDELDSRT